MGEPGRHQEKEPASRAEVVLPSTDRGYVGLDDADLLRQCRVEAYRASGPGGQKRNKTSSAIRLRHRPTAIAVVATESRSQHENKARALRRLRRALALGVRRTVDVKTYVPSSLLSSCVSDHRRLVVGRRDGRYLVVVAEILDVLHACRGQLSTAGAVLRLGTGNLSAFLRRDDKLRACVNDIRAAYGARPIR